MASPIARSCKLFETYLSRNGQDLVDHLPILRHGPAIAAKIASSVRSASRTTTTPRALAG